VIPYYYGEKYIKNTLNSLVNAIKKVDIVYEIIIVNDSPQEDIQYLKDIYCNLTIIINDSNKGIAESRNIGKHECRNEYLYFIDQDDWVDENLLIVLKKYIDNNYDCIIFNYNEVYFKDDNIIKVSKGYNGLFNILINYFINDKIIFKYGNFFRTIGQLIIKREIAPDFLITNAKGSDDMFMFMDIFSKQKRLNISYENKPLLYYRIHKNNYTKVANFDKSTEECFEKYILKNKNFKKYSKYLKIRYKENILHRVINKFLHVIIKL
jgi:glycosyltransferase involved in cell wall biosynthesis